MTITLRRAVDADIDMLWTMLYYAAQMDREGGRAPEDARGDPYLRVYVEGWGLPTDLGVIALDAGQPVGAVWSRLIDHAAPTDLAPPTAPELAAAVLPSHQGRGIGTLLLRDYLARAAGRFPAVTLTVRADNPALRLYERAGFSVTGTLTNRVGTVSYAMICHLSPSPGSPHQRGGQTD